MASRGRGRGRGANRTLTREQLNNLGIGNEAPVQLSNPQPLFAPLHQHIPSAESSQNLEYEIVLNQTQNNYTQLSCIDFQDKNSVAVQVKLLKRKDFHDLAYLFPNELRPKIKAWRKIKIEKNIEIEEKKIEIEEKKIKVEETKWEESESHPFDIDAIKTEPTVDEEEEEEEKDEDEDMENPIDENNEDQELDVGTDYGNNYFDNGDGFSNDEDDNLDDI